MGILILILIGTVLRAWLTVLPGFKIDVEAWFAWALRLNEVGFANFYSSEVFTVFAPGYLYILSLLGFIKNLLNIDNQLFFQIVKLPSIISEVILAILVYKEVKRYLNINLAYLISLAIILNPGFIFNSSIWGQTDGVLTLFLFLTIYFLKERKLSVSSFFMGLSLLIKPQAIAIIPIFVIFLMRNFSIKNFLGLFLPASLVILILSLPFFPKNPLIGLYDFLLNSINEYNVTSLFAYNFWGIIGFWIDDSRKFMDLSFKGWGYLLYLGYWLMLTFFYFKKKLSIYQLATLATLSFFFLPTRVHERYLYPGLFFLILLTFQIKNTSFLILTFILNLMYLLNLYFVYTYYNQFYFNLENLLFVESIYVFLQNNSQLLSSLSTVIFVFLTVIIIKLNYGSKIAQS